MCGIVGVYNVASRDILLRMSRVQSHRGPDDDGDCSVQSPSGVYVGIASRRLAIQDLSPAGHMPMSTEDGLVSIVYNGEIYNHLQLRERLIEKGYAFRSHSDTETILYLYCEYGPDCVKLLNGMFALAIVDRRRMYGERPLLFFARDHFGVKPLYYWSDGGRLAFASEVKALLHVPDVQRRLNMAALQQYLTFLWVPDPLTLFDGILKLPAGHYALYDGRELRITKYWDLSYPDQGKIKPVDDERALAEELRHRFEQTVRAQMLSDVTVGAFLSAGLDSSSIVAFMARASDQPVRTYTIGYAEKYLRGETTMDDVTVARRTAAHFGCRHTEIIAEPDVVDLLPKLIWHMDEPVADPAIIACFLVSRAARENVTVLLSGVGGDEVFAGYRKHRAHFLAQDYQRVPGFLRTGIVEPLVNALPSFRGSSLKGYVRLAKKMVRSGSLPPRERFVMDSAYLTERQLREVLQSSITESPLATHMSYFQHVAEADFLNQMLYLDVKTFMVSLNLTYNDKMTMAASVEGRVPFLDWELAEWVAKTIPVELKLKGATTKHIFREAMRPILPPEVLRQSKAGFGAPVDYWLAHDLHEMVDDLLSHDKVRRRGLLDPVVVRRYVDEHRSGRRDWSLQLWAFLTLELWQQAFMDTAQ